MLKALSRRTAPQLFGEVVLHPLKVLSELGSSRHPEGCHLRLLPEPEQPEAAQERHQDRESYDLSWESE